ncbi:MAG: M48 family metalloprotease [bacterium]|nr:M48 family metalloprotease [bacterium]
MSPTTHTGQVPERNEMLHLLDGSIEPVKKPLLYTVGLFLVTVVMVLLPVIYVGLIAGAGYLTYLHAVENVGILSGSGTRFRLLAYVAPLVAGIVVCIFMVKPLFARPARGPEPISVEPEEEPLLFAWIDRLRRLVGAPMPVRIDVNCAVNASASFRRGLRSMFGRDLVLTIGLPLVAGMTLRQFTGVLAHELGHFAQGGGMRLSHLIRSINFWFARVVHERDGFDETLDGMMDSGALWLMAIGGVAKVCVWLSRRILWVLMQFGHLVSCFLLRQMEYDADRYETRVSGSDDFHGTMDRLHELMVGEDVGQNNLGRLWSEKKLPENLPGYFVAQLGMVERDALQDYLQGVAQQGTRWLDTHPANRDRVASAERENAPGLLQTGSPATALFTDFDAVSARASAAFYAAALDQVIDERYLVPTTELLEDQERDVSRDAGIGRFFQGASGDEGPYFPEFVTGPADTELEGLRAKIVATRSQLVAAYEEESQNRMSLANRRLGLAMQLLHFDQVKEKLPGDKDPADEATGLLDALACLQQVKEPSEQMVGVLESFFWYVERIQNNQSDERAQRGIKEEVGKLHALFGRIRAGMETTPYPFVHVDGEISCAVFVAPEEVGEMDPNAVINGSQLMMDRQNLLYIKALARLVELAKNAEGAVGLEPLEEPVRKDAE